MGMKDELFAEVHVPVLGAQRRRHAGLRHVFESFP